MASTKGFDPSKDEIIDDWGEFDLDDVRVLSFKVVSYNGGEQKLAIAEGIRKKDGTIRWKTGKRRPLDECRLMLSLFLNLDVEDVNWESFAEAAELVED